MQTLHKGVCSYLPLPESAHPGSCMLQGIILNKETLSEPYRRHASGHRRSFDSMGGLFGMLPRYSLIYSNILRKEQRISEGLHPGQGHLLHSNSLKSRYSLIRRKSLKLPVTTYAPVLRLDGSFFPAGFFALRKNCALLLKIT